MDGAPDFRERLKDIAVWKGLSQKELADRIGASRNAVNRFFGGRTILHTSQFIKLCRELGIDIDTAIVEAHYQAFVNASQKNLN
jgi:transcriptional regulator with XRE-family HTH domain